MRALEATFTHTGCEKSRKFKQIFRRRARRPPPTPPGQPVSAVMHSCTAQSCFSPQSLFSNQTDDLRWSNFRPAPPHVQSYLTKNTICDQRRKCEDLRGFKSASLNKMKCLSLLISLISGFISSLLFLNIPSFSLCMPSLQPVFLLIWRNTLKMDEWSRPGVVAHISVFPPDRPCTS